jgi:hypothetical protein
VTFSFSHPGPGDRLGVDRCPGIDERGHGLTMAVIHDPGCCIEWAGGEAAPARTEAFREAASRWGSTWPKPAAEPEAEPEAGL